MSSILAENLDAIRAVCRSYQVEVLYAFGSSARNDMHGESDVDFLYMFSFDRVEALRRQGISYIHNLFGLEAYLKRIVQRPVGLVPYGGTRNPVMLAEIEATKKLLYAEG